MAGGCKARVVALGPNALVEVELEDGQRITAHLAGKMRMNLVRLIEGDAVTVEVSALDRRKGRIIARG